MRLTSFLASACLAVTPAFAQTGDPFPEPIGAGEDAIVVDVVEHATLPTVDGERARLMTLRHEAGSDRLFVSDMRGILYIVDDDGSVSEYLNMDASRWGVDVGASWREMGLQSFAFHPQFAEEGTPGYGKFYAWTDTTNTEPQADANAGSDDTAHHTVLLEWTAENPMAGSYDGGPPREIARFEQPFSNHNGGDLMFNPLAEPGDEDYGLLYVGVGDGGSGGDPLNLAQDMGSAFGKILRIDPLGDNGLNGEYGVPQSNPFVDGADGVLPEIYASGLRNPQHIAWDSETGDMMVADIGQGTVEEVSVVEAGDNLGWNEWEGSFRFVDGSNVDTSNSRSDSQMRYPFAEYDHQDPLLGGGAAVTGLEVVRSGRVPEIEDRILFGDLPSGELFAVDADDRPDGGQAALRRVLFDDGSGEPQTLLELIQARNAEQDREQAQRTDLRLGNDGDGNVYLLNKYDDTLRRLAPSM